MTRSVTDATLVLTKEFAIFGLVVSHATIVAVELGISETATKGWLRCTGLVDSFLLLEFPRSSLTSDVFLLEHSDKFLGSDL